MVKEIELSSRFRGSERVVRLLGACLGDRRHVCLIMELVEGGNLAQRIYDKRKRRMTYLEILQVGFDVATGLAYLHPTVIHRDLKPQNILLDKYGRAKIADFGISRFKDPYRSYLSITQPGGTPNYMAPELFNGKRVDEKCDVYSLGCILYECVSRKTPFSDLTRNQFNMLYKIIMAVAINGQRPPIPENVPKALRDLIQRCWREDPRNRPSTAEVMRLLDLMQHEEVEKLTTRKNLASQTRGSASRSNVAASSDSPHMTMPPPPHTAAEEPPAHDGAVRELAALSRQCLSAEAQSTPLLREMEERAHPAASSAPSPARVSSSSPPASGGALSITLPSQPQRERELYRIVSFQLSGPHLLSEPHTDAGKGGRRESEGRDTREGADLGRQERERNGPSQQPYSQHRTFPHLNRVLSSREREAASRPVELAMAPLSASSLDMRVSVRAVSGLTGRKGDKPDKGPASHLLAAPQSESLEGFGAIHAHGSGSSAEVDGKLASHPGKAPVSAAAYGGGMMAYLGKTPVLAADYGVDMTDNAGRTAVLTAGHSGEMADNVEMTAESTAGHSGEMSDHGGESAEFGASLEELEGVGRQECRGRIN